MIRWLPAIARGRDLQGGVIYAGFLAIFLFFAFTLHDDGFLTTRNLSNIVLQTAPATVMAIGFVFVLSAGEIDLSFGRRGDAESFNAFRDLGRIGRRIGDRLL